MHMDLPYTDHRVQYPVEYHRPIEVANRKDETPEMKEARRIWKDIIHPMELIVIQLYKDARWHERGVEIEDLVGEINLIRQKLIKIYYPKEDKKLPEKKKK